MSGLIFGPFALILGLKGFGDAGMPFSKTRIITGEPAKVVGLFCVLLGVLMTLGGVMSVIPVFGRVGTGVDRHVPGQRPARRRVAEGGWQGSREANLRPPRGPSNGSAGLRDFSDIPNVQRPSEKEHRDPLGMACKKETPPPDAGLAFYLEIYSIR